MALWLVGYPGTALRTVSTWRRLAHLNALSVSLGPDRRVIGRDLVVQGQTLKPKPPRLSWPMPTASGLTVRVLPHPGQTPAPFFAAARAMEHTAYQGGRRRRGETDEDPFEAYNPFRQGRH